MRKAANLLARRAWSCGELRDRLLKGSSPADVDAVIRRLQELHLLNDPEVAYNFASDRIRQRGWGPVKVYHSLVGRQVSPHIAEAAVERVRIEAGDRPLLENYLEKHWRTRPLPRGHADVGRLVAHLRRRGFEESIIFEVLRRKVPGAVLRSLETE
jgi:SOS response regulatory protein OraA/RecX